MSISGSITPEPEEVEDPAPESNVTQITEEEITKSVPFNEPEPVTAPAVVKDSFLETLLTKIVPVNKAKRNLKVMIYSDPGVGKTVFAGTCPDNFFINAEEGLVSLANHPDIVAESVFEWRYTNFNAFEAIINKLNENPPELAHLKTVTIDTVSELHKKGLAEVTKRAWVNSPSVKNRYVAEVEDHSENNEHIRQVVSQLRDLNRNVILLAHARTLEPKNGPHKTFPDFSEKLANTLAGIVDIVGYMYFKEVEGEVVRVLRLQGTPSIIAKTRIGGYPEELINPTWTDLWTVFQKAKDSVED